MRPCPAAHRLHSRRARRADGTGRARAFDARAHRQPAPGIRCRCRRGRRGHPRALGKASVGRGGARGLEPSPASPCVAWCVWPRAGDAQPEPRIVKWDRPRRSGLLGVARPARTRCLRQGSSTSKSTLPSRSTQTRWPVGPYAAPNSPVDFAWRVRQHRRRSAPTPRPAAGPDHAVDVDEHVHANLQVKGCSRR